METSTDNHRAKVLRFMDHFRNEHFDMTRTTCALLSAVLDVPVLMSLANLSVKVRSARIREFN